MKPGLSGLELLKEHRIGSVTHLRFQQSYQGLPVYEAQYLVHLNAEGRVTMANGTFYPKIEAPTTPQLSERAAQQRALRDLPGQPARGDGTGNLVIFPEGDQFRLAWKLTVPLEPNGGWLYVVDARDGTVLFKHNLLTDASTRGLATVIGDGKVYPKHPDNSSVTVKNLYRLTGNGTLTSTYANITNDEASEAYSSNHSFQYAPTNTHFDEVNLYYHIDRFRNNFIDGLEDSQNTLGFTQITAHAHSTCNGSDVNACYDPTTGRLHFGDASSESTFNDFAKEDMVFYHEYGHALNDDQNSGIQSTCEQEGSISEGVPDYFAGAFTGRTIFGDYVLPNGHDGLRNMANPSISLYSDYQAAEGTYSGFPCFGSGVEPHDGGEFFSAVLWDTRTSFQSPSEADWLVFAALSYISADPTLFEFRSALLSEDDAEYNGKNRCRIFAAFAGRGLGTKCLQQATLSGPEVVGTNEYASWSVDVDGGKGPFTHDWYDEPNLPIDESPELTDEDPAEDVYAKYTGGSSDDFYLKAEVTDDRGDTASTLTYFIDVQSGGGCTGECTNAVIANNQPTALPDTFALGGSAPNPARRQTNIQYAVPEATVVTLTVHDVMGRRVARLTDRRKAAGFHDASFDASDLPSGVYFYRMQAGTFTETKRLVVVR